MEILIAAVVAAAVAAIVVVAGQRRGPAAAAAGHAPPPPEARPEVGDTSVLQATATAPAPVPAASVAAPAPIDDSELRVRRAEIARIEERLLSKEEALDLRLAELERKERSLEDRTRN